MENKEETTFKIEKELLEKLEKIAKEKNLQSSELVVECIKYALENFDEMKKTNPELNKENLEKLLEENKNSQN